MRILAVVLAWIFATITAIYPAIASDESKSAKSCPGTRRILVTGGGGVRGAYQVGAIWYLVNVLDCNFDSYVGTSTGAITAAMLAQSKGMIELRRNVDSLVDTYLSIKSKNDIVARRTFGTIRLVLPQWFGGVSGIYTLGPVMEKMSRLINYDDIPPGKLSVPVVSIQSGLVKGDRFTSLSDQIIGSASIPVAMEPRKARLWSTGAVININENHLTLISYGHPGLVDDRCEVILAPSPHSYDGKKYRRYRCVYEKHEPLSGGTLAAAQTVLNSRGGFTMDDDVEDLLIDPKSRSIWFTILRVDGLTDKANDYLHKKVPQTETIEDALRLINTKELYEVTYTTVHQLVDGGVAENLPIATGMRGAASSYSIMGAPEFDVMFALGTGSSSLQDKSRDELQGGLQLAEASFEWMWRYFSAQAIKYNRADHAEYSSVYERNSQIEKIKKWREQLEAFLPSEMWNEINNKMPFPKISDNPVDTPPTTIFLLNPSTIIFDETLDADPVKIKQALYEGCQLAAKATDKIVTGQFVAVTKSDIDAEPCRRFLGTNLNSDMRH